MEESAVQTGDWFRMTHPTGPGPSRDRSQYASYNVDAELELTIVSWLTVVYEVML